MVLLLPRVVFISCRLRLFASFFPDFHNRRTRVTVWKTEAAHTDLRHVWSWMSCRVRRGQESSQGRGRNRPRGHTGHVASEAALREGTWHSSQTFSAGTVV